MKDKVNIQFEFKDWGHWIHLHGSEGLIMSIPEYQQEPNYFHNWYVRGMEFCIAGVEQLTEHGVVIKHEVYQKLEELAGRLMEVKVKQHRMLCKTKGR